MTNKKYKIALGSVQFGLNYGIGNTEGKTNSAEVSKILNTAYSEGIRIVDTAQAYGDSEQVLGRLHDNRFQIITKINPVARDPRSAGVMVQESLKNLNLKGLYGLLFHSAGSAIDNPKIVSELKELQKEGIIQKLGFSVYSPKELKQLISLYGIPDIIQIPFSHLDQRFENIAIDLHHKGVEIHSRSTYLQGLYFRDNNQLTEFFKPIDSYHKNLRDSFHENGQLARALLNFSLNKDFIDNVVIGVNNQVQLIENTKRLKSSEINLPPVPKNIPEKILMPHLWPQ